MGVLHAYMLKDRNCRSGLSVWSEMLKSHHYNSKTLTGNIYTGLFQWKKSIISLCIDCAINVIIMPYITEPEGI